MNKPKKMSPAEIKRLNAESEAISGEELKPELKTKPDAKTKALEGLTEEDLLEEELELKPSQILESVAVEFKNVISKGQLQEHFKTLINKLKEAEKALNM